MFSLKKKQTRLHKTRVCIKFLYSSFNFIFETLQFQIHKTLLNLLLNPSMFMVSLSPAFLPAYLSPFQYAPPAFSASIYLPCAPCSLTFQRLLCINFVSIPPLHPICSILLKHLFFLFCLCRTVSTSKIIPVPFKCFSKALFSTSAS